MLMFFVGVLIGVAQVYEQEGMGYYGGDYNYAGADLACQNYCLSFPNASTYYSYPYSYDQYTCFCYDENYEIISEKLIS
jgi:hypothetical protein